jgi:riboflavin-specific deaminase-like protein
MMRPFVTANFAITADGKISTRKLTKSDFSSKADKRQLLEIRAGCDAVLVGARTLSTDSMTMGLPAEDLQAARRKRGKPSHPLRVVFTSTGRISPEARVFTADIPNVPVVFSTRRMPTRTVQALAGVCDLFLHLADEVNLAAALATLREDYGVRRVVCEGGGALLRALLEAGLVDELHATICPRIFGGRKAPTITGLPADFLPASTALRLVELQGRDGEWFTRWRVTKPKILTTRKAAQAA